MNHDLISLFPVPIFKTTIGPVDPIIMAWIKNLNFDSLSVAYDDTDSADDVNKGMFILEKPKLQSLKNSICDRVNYFAHEVLKVEDNVNFELQTSWINRVRSDEIIGIHNHSNSHLSGVFYLETDPNSAPIYFQKALSSTNLFHSSFEPGYKEQNIFNCTSFEHRPKTGDLLIFPSHLEHWVPDGSASDRYSLAFNFYAKGMYGHGTNQISV